MMISYFHTMTFTAKAHQLYYSLYLRTHAGLDQSFGTASVNQPLVWTNM